MTDPASVNEEETRRLIVAIIDFLREELVIRTDLDPEDRECLEMAIQSLEMAYDLEGMGHLLSYRLSRPLRDIFNQVTNPVSVKDKLRADAHKEEGNNYMRRKMYIDAEAEYTNAIELDKWNSIYYCNRGSARIEQQRYFDGIVDCRQALMLNPDYARAHGRMGQAYALMHRHREAARCFRQAVQLEPQNEKYIHNLRVSENEANRPDPAQLVTNLLASLLGFGPQNTLSGNSSSMPTSFMIITERSRPSSGALSQNNERSQVSESIPVTETNTQESEIPINFSTQNNNMFRFLDNVIDMDEEEQFEQHSPLQNQNRQNSHNPNEILVEIPLPFGIDFLGSMQSPSTQDETDLQIAEIEDTKSTGNTQENILDEKTHAQTESEMKPDDLENTHAALNDFTKKSDEKNQQDDEDRHSSTESKPLVKDTAKTDTNDTVKNTETEVTENEVTSSNENNSFNNNFNNPSRNDNYTENENHENVRTLEKDNNDVHDNVNASTVQNRKSNKRETSVKSSLEKLD